MAHSLQEYNDLIRRLEQENQDQPTRYRIKLFLLALLGIGYILAMLILALLLSVGLIGVAILSKNPLVIKFLIKIIIIPVALSFFIFKAIFVKFEPPKGHYLRKNEAPGLFKLIKQTQKSLNAKPIHEIVITPEINAAVTQVPRLGMLGWPRRYLIIGLPLLKMLSVDELNAVIGHEFGHLTKNHMRFSNWIYRIRTIWYVLLDKLGESSRGISWIFTSFFTWFAPYFNAYSFVLARNNEYEADREAASITSIQAAGNALVKTYAYANYTDHSYWRTVYNDVKDQPLAPSHVYTNQINEILAVETEKLGVHVENALKEKTGIEDTHPCLSDRLKALQTSIDIRPVEKSYSAASLLKNSEELLNQFDQQWKDQIKEEWSWRHSNLKSFRETIERYRPRELDSLDEKELLEFAIAVDNYESSEAAMPLYKALLEKNDNHAAANYILGRQLLYERDDSGIDLVNKAIDLDEDLIEEGVQLLYEYYFYAKNDGEAAQPYFERLRKIRREQIKAEDERAELSHKSDFVPHELDESKLQEIIDAIKKLPNIKKVWLVKRKVIYFPKIPSYFAMYQMKGMVFREEKLTQNLADTIGNLVELGSVHVAIASKHRRLKRKITKVQSSQII